MIRPSNLEPATAAAPLGAVLVGSFARAGGVVVLLAAIAAAAGLAPEGAAPYLALGVGAAIAATGFAVVFHGRILDRRFAAGLANDPRLIAGRLQGLMALGLLAKLAAVTVGVLTLRAAGVKFGGVATFCVAFAAGALACQLVTAMLVARSRQVRVASADLAEVASPLGER